MRCLTNHDLVWLNAAIVGKSQDYDYFAVENSTAGQYVYGKNNDIVVSAATLYERLMKVLPFARGNRRTAFVAMVAMLAANGWQLSEEATTVLTALANLENHTTEARLVLEPLASPIAPTAGLTSYGMRQIAAWCMKRHEQALNLLASAD